MRPTPREAATPWGSVERCVDETGAVDKEEETDVAIKPVYVEPSRDEPSRDLTLDLALELIRIEIANPRHTADAMYTKGIGSEAAYHASISLRIAK